MRQLGPKILCTAALLTGMGASASATASTMDAGLYQSILDDIGERIVAGVRADLRGPCLPPEGFAQVLLDWTPLGVSAQQAVAQVLQERGIAPQEVA